MKDARYYMQPENARERWENPDNPYDQNSPFLREDFEQKYRNSLYFNVPYDEYMKGYLEGRYVIPSTLESPFVTDATGVDDKSHIANELGGVSYYDSDGNYERCYYGPKETAGLRQIGSVFFDDTYEGHKTLVDLYNQVNGSDFLCIYPKGRDYFVYGDPNLTGRDFCKRYEILENVIARNNHAEVSKAALLPFIKSEEDRRDYMDNPSSDKVLEIFRKQLGLPTKKASM